MPKKPAKTTYWSLYIDESGNFDDPEEQVLLAAVAVPDNNSPLFAARLKAAIQDAAPLIPWPFHRWLATKPTMHAIWWQLASEDQRQHPNVPTYYKEAAQQAIATWQEHAPGLLKNVVLRLKQNDEPTPGQIRELYNTLKRRDDALLQLLNIYSDHTCTVVSQSLSALIAEDNKGFDAYSFLTIEDAPGDAQKEENTRYFTLLTTLLGRTRDVFTQLPGNHVITVHLASRYAEHPDLPAYVGANKKYSLNLTKAHIREACQRAMAISPPVPGETPPFRFSTGQISTYTKNVPSPLIIADTAANLFFHSLYHWPQQSAQGLERFHIPAQHILRLPLSLQGFAPSHVSAPGHSQNLIDQARRSLKPTTISLNHIQSPWAVEQTAQWIAFFDKVGEEIQ